MHRPGKPEGMHYLSHQSIDAANGMIVDVAVTPGDVDVYKRQVVDGMADIGFIFHNALDLGYRPCVAFFLRRTRIDVCESPVLSLIHI